MALMYADGAMFLGNSKDTNEQHSLIGSTIRTLVSILASANLATILANNDTVLTTEVNMSSAIPEVVCSGYYVAHTGAPYSVTLTSGHGGALLTSGVLAEGMSIVGTIGIQAGTEVLSIGSNNTITMTKPATVAVADGQLTDNLTFFWSPDQHPSASAIANDDTVLTTEILCTALALHNRLSILANKTLLTISITEDLDEPAVKDITAALSIIDSTDTFVEPRTETEVI